MSCSGLTSVTIGNSVTSIGEYAFKDCSSLTSVTFHCGNIGSWFSGMNNISEMTIGEEVTNIDSEAFRGCSGLTSVTIPNSVTSIGYATFRDCSGLTSVTIGNSVTSIGEYAFYGCSGLTSVTIPNSVTSISGYAFEDCSSLTRVTIGNSVTSIGYRAFSSCSKLESFTIGTGVLSIGSSVFNNHRPAKVIWLTNTPPEGYRNAIGTINYVANNLYTGLSNTTEYKFLSSLFEVDGVKYVPVSPSDRTCDVIDCCYDDTVKNIHIGKTVTNKGVTLNVEQVHPYSFYNNEYIETATFDEGFTSLGEYTFAGCSSLKGFTIPNSVMTIGKSAFSGCTSLSEIRIPKAVTDIKNSVFNQCSSLKTVIMEDREKVLNLGSNRKNSYDYGNPLFSDCPLDSVYIGGNINYDKSSNYGYSPFYRNTSLRTVVITDRETEISENEFYGCTNLQDVKIGDGVESFGDWAFSGCSSLKHLSFGTNVKRIGQEAFSDCTAVTRIASRALTPPVCGSQALDDINKWECTLKVPSNSIADYQEADQWKEFFFIDDIESGIVGIEKEKPAVQHYYSPNGKLLDKPQRGLNIVVMPDGTTRKFVVK